jgi:hypothetical protein
MRRFSRLLPWALGAIATVVALTWALEHAMPPPYSGYLAVVLVGLALTHIVKRQPQQQAARMLRAYLRARERGDDEARAREQLLARLYPDPLIRQRTAGDLDAVWTGPSERDRVIGGVAALLAHNRKTLDHAALAAIYDRLRDQFTIPGWDALPREFVVAVRGRLGQREREQLDALALRYRLFHQNFFRSPSSLAADPAAGAAEFARLLNSMGNRLSPDEPGDAERAYRLSLSVQPERNLAHAGLALLLERTGRARDAAREARTALEVLDDYARRAAHELPSHEDIGPFKSPAELRSALQQVADGPQ